jgi:phosphatidate cytidylyltransferase
MPEQNGLEFRSPGKGSRNIFSGLGPRALVALAGIPLLIAAVYAGDWWLWALVLLISLLAQWEYYAMAAARGHHPLKLPGLAGGLLILLCFRFGPGLWTGLAVLWLLSLMGLEAFKSRVENSISRISSTLFGVAYVPVMLGHMNLLRNDQVMPGFKLLVLILVLVWANDTGAYFTGLTLGKKPLAPRVSPKKSWEGLWGGMALSVSVSLVLARYWVYELTLLHAGVIALGVVAFGTLGDLFESMLKRDAGIKDSGTMLPGHGGLLDRFDSLIFAVPIVYWYCKLVVFR